jgi:protoporphyrinogen oxidase
VWGIPCNRISAEWAAQRIKGLSLTSAVLHSLLKSRRRRPKTLVDEFLYPRLGAGQLYDKMATMIRAAGGNIRTDCRVTKILRRENRVVAVDCAAGDGPRRIGTDYLLSSAPLSEIVELFSPPAPPDVLAAARALRYRNHIAVQLVVRGQRPFPDNWIYVHSPDVEMARVCSYRNFSAAMAKAEDYHPLTVEYFCFPEDEIWQRPDEALIELAVKELAAVQMIEANHVADAFVIRSQKAYPVIELGAQENVELIKAWIDRFENMLPIGRSGMFKYNNQDHAIATGLLAARAMLGHGDYDPWQVNIDGIYHEGRTTTVA